MTDAEWIDGLREPTPPTYDEALATKLDRKAEEAAARLLK